jgi:choline dehydrogenase-like flavoprotein
MVFDRGSKADYDDWAELGNKGWDWDTLFPYFKKVRYLSQTQPVSNRSRYFTVLGFDVVMDR